jgi:dihydrofolate reductase
MRKLVLKMSMSIDGFVGGPNGEIDWLFKSMSERTNAWIVDAIAQAGVHLMGSKTYYDMKAYWPYSSDPVAAPMNDIPKVVFTKKGLVPDGQTTTAIKDATAADKAKGTVLSTESNKLDSWRNATVASGDLAVEIHKLKQQPGGFILAHGGAGFVQNLIQTGLVDEFRLVIHPVVLGTGLPIFSKLLQPIDMDLVSSTSLPLGVVANVYQPH